MFTQNTAEKFRNWLPSPSLYVKEAIDPKNVKEWAELLEKITRKFKIDLVKNRELGSKVKLWELPDFDNFILEINTFKQELKKIILDYNKWLNTKWQILDKIWEIDKYIDKINSWLISEDKFMYYYEIKQLKILLQEIEKL